MASGSAGYPLLSMVFVTLPRCKDRKSSANHQMICGVFLYSCVICPKNRSTSMFSSSSSWLWLVCVVISSMPWKFSPRSPLTTEKMRSDNSKAATRYNDFTKEVIKERYMSYKGKGIMIPASIFGYGDLENKSKWIESIKLRLEDLDIIAHKKSLTKK